MKSTLLLSFVDHDDLYVALDKISNTINIPKGSIFVFKVETLDSYALTYNLDAENSNIQFDSIWPNTISIHRKKQTNSLYSLNAMNQLIKNENGGIFNKAHIVNWKNYKNSLMIIKGGALDVLKLQMIRINQ